MLRVDFPRTGDYYFLESTDTVSQQEPFFMGNQASNGVRMREKEREREGGRTDKQI